MAEVPESSPKTPDGEKFSCVHCDRPDSHDNFVQCDQCDNWWHMSCAGVSGSIESREWSCPDCSALSVCTGTTSSSRRAARLQLKMKLLEEKQAIQTRILEEKYKLLEDVLDESDDARSHRSRVSRRSNLDKVKQWRQKCAEQMEGATGLSKDTQEAASLTKQSEALNLRETAVDKPGGTSLTDKEECRHQQLDGSAGGTHKADKQPLGKIPPAGKLKQSLEEAVGGKLGCDKQQQQEQKSKGAVRKTHPNHQERLQKPDKVPPGPKGNQSMKSKLLVGKTGDPPASSVTLSGKPLHHNPDDSASSSSDDNSLQRLLKRLGHVGLPKTNPVPSIDPGPSVQGYPPNLDFVPTPSQSAPRQDMPHNLPQIADFAPSPSQIAARQVMSRDLPPFSGNPADWPIFISSFTNTTLACGYNSAENLARLQRCLKGVAFEAVKSRLLLPASVPQVIDTLRMLYGRPELLINALLDKVRTVQAPRAEKLETLIDFGMAVQSLCDHLEAADQQAHLSNPSLLMELVEKLPAHIKMEWAGYLQKYSEVNLKTFCNFMEAIMVSASKVTLYSGGSFKTASAERNKPKQKGSVFAHSGEAEVKREPERQCYVCKKPNHRLADCGMFKAFNVDARWKFAQNNGLCRNCLNGHGKRACRSPTVCGIDGCQYRHHPLLHSYSPNASTAAAPSRMFTRADNHTHRQTVEALLFRIVPVTLFGPQVAIDTYAFLDDGSSLTLIESDLVKQLEVGGTSEPLCLTWTGNVTRMEPESIKVQLSISEAGSSKQLELKDVHTVKELTLPTQSLHYGDLVEHFGHLRGLPVASYARAVPRLLVGLNNLNLTVPLKAKEGKISEPVAVKTRLGWCIYGGRGVSGSVQSLNFHACKCTNYQELHNIVKDYFTLEDVGAKPVVNLESEDDRRANDILLNTTLRIGKRFETGLLWRFNHVEFPDSYIMALRRLECLERKMARDTALSANLHQQMTEYQEKRYAHPATQDELNSADPKRVWYLPVGAVTNPRKPGKVRMVWDAAAKVNGISLNTQLMKGPDQLTSLPAVLARFRQFKVGVTADIKEMFHQISIREADRHSQRFLWRTDPSKPPEIYLMDVATFGSSCSPTSAQYVKNKNAEEFVDRYPRAVKGIIENHYVDDFLDSFESEEEAGQVSEEVRMIHGEAGFQLRGWQSNSSTVLQRLGETRPSRSKQLSLDKNSEFERVLGMLWLTTEDVLCFSTMLKEEIKNLIDNNERPTKRQVLKCLMGFFDPLGLLSSFLVHGKILLQDVWRSGIQWDEKVHDDVWERWSRWTSLFPKIADIRIPRCYFKNANAERYEQLQLHVFVDASEGAYSAVALFRTFNTVGVVECILVAAKTKVAPLKPCSIPRLELQAAVLGTRLMQFVMESHSFPITQRFFWSDSATVLAWIRADHRRYKQYVACRIGEILTVTDVDEWRWVPTKLNPADVATKWGKGPCLDPNSAWFIGPDFLRLPEEDWPQQTAIILTTGEELRPCHAHQGFPVPVPIVEFNRFSKWKRLLRATAYVQRFIANLKKKRKGEVLERDHLTSEELQSAKKSLIRMVQWEVYSYEQAAFTHSKMRDNQIVQLEKTSRLYQLSPFHDDTGILRIDGRIGLAPHATIGSKFPIILPRKHKVTILLLDEFHRTFRHSNAETVVNEIRQEYYVPQLRVVAKEVTKNCQWCKVYNSQPMIPRMGSLPLARLASFTRPFTYVGLDFFGPLLVKVGRSNAKRWIALFTCLTVRAVHVEVSYSLTTDSCVECVRRFVCRRGSPAEIHSDNGTNFHGADGVLKQQMQDIHGELVASFTSTTTKWIFIPPGAPHMGGAWERMVRSVKSAMETAYNNDRKLDDESLLTMVIEAEGMVNTRPLTYLPLDSEESEALTPNHFLLGSSSGVRQPVVEPTDAATALRNSWGLIQQQLDGFWRRWIREYLPTLTRRTKWFGEVKPIAVDDLVFIVDGSKRNAWVRGRVQQVFTAKDGRVRQALIQTARGWIFKRPVSKLAVLDVVQGGKTGIGGQCYGGEDVADWPHWSSTAPIEAPLAIGNCQSPEPSNEKDPSVNLSSVRD